MRTAAMVPWAALSIEYGTPALARAALAMSQDRTKLFLPSGSNCNPQARASAMTVTGHHTVASSSAGFAKCVIPWNIGK